MPIVANSNERIDDVSVPFMLDAFGIHGRCVSLSESVDRILSGHKYPERAGQLLGELLILTTMIGSLMKLKGTLTLQIKGDGALPFMTADYSEGGAIRGYAHIEDREHLETLKLIGRKKQNIQKVFGGGVVVITIEQPNIKPYQAIVPLEGKSLSDCILTYFKQSNQINCVIESASQKVQGKWRARGVLIQKIAEQGGKKVDISHQKTTEERQDEWDTTKVLLQSVTDEELLDEKITPHDLLFRLFNQYGIRAFDPALIKASCRCSREKMEKALLMLPEDEIQTLSNDGTVSMQCHFCNHEEVFNLEELLNSK